MARRRPDGSVVSKKGDIGGKTTYARASARAPAERALSGDSSSQEDQATLQLVWSQQRAPAREKAIASIGNWAKSAPKKRRESVSDKQVKAKAELERMIEDEDWSGARPIHFVLLYCMLHETVYGVEPMELRGQLNRQAAARMALTMLQRDFANDSLMMLDYVRWSWTREEEREEWRRRNNTGRRRLTWRLQFGGELLTEYLILRVGNERV